MSENRARYPIAVMCRILGVSPSGYYAWVKRPASARALMDAALTAEIRAAHAASKGTYGAPRLQIDLAEAGIRVSRKRVARLMLNAGLVGVSRRKSAVTTVRDGARQAPDLVDRNFTADQPNRLWVADITYIPTWGGFLYLAVVLDAFSRRIVGWSMATTLHMQVVLDALNMALWQRRPSGVIHHSDHGSQADSNGRRNTLEEEVAMGTRKRGRIGRGERRCRHRVGRLWRDAMATRAVARAPDRHQESRSSRLLVSLDRCQALIIRSNSRICALSIRNWAPSAARHVRAISGTRLSLRSATIPSVPRRHCVRPARRSRTLQDGRGSR